MKYLIIDRIDTFSFKIVRNFDKTHKFSKEIRNYISESLILFCICSSTLKLFNNFELREGIVIWGNCLEFYSFQNYYSLTMD